MAKAPKTTKTPISKEALDLSERVGKRIIALLRDIDEPYAVEGMHTRPIMKKDDPRPGYRQKPITPKSEHFLTSFYLGAKGQLIFKAVPTDTNAYDWADVDQDSMDKVFPMVGSALAEVLELDDNVEDFIEIVNVVRAQIVAEDLSAATAAVEEKKQADEAYNQNPNFGLF